MSVFHSDDGRSVIVTPGSDYYLPLDCLNRNPTEYDGLEVCQVPVAEYVDAFFGGMFKRKHIPRDLIILGCILTVVRISTLLALRFVTYSGK